MSRHRTSRAWVAGQTILFVALLLGPLLERDSFSTVWIALGGILMVWALAWMVYAYRSLAGMHSPWAEPVVGGQLVTGGAYAIVRHPIYTGWIGLAVGWGLLSSSAVVLGIACVLALFYDRRASYEERRLGEAYPDYRTYCQRVRRFVPRIY